MRVLKTKKKENDKKKNFNCLKGGWYSLIVLKSQWYSKNTFNVRGKYSFDSTRDCYYKMILLKIAWKVLWWIYPQSLKIYSFGRHSILIDCLTCLANQKIYKIYCFHLQGSIFLCVISFEFIFISCLHFQQQGFMYKKMIRLTYRRQLQQCTYWYT